MPQVFALYLIMTLFEIFKFNISIFFYKIYNVFFVIIYDITILHFKKKSH